MYVCLKLCVCVCVRINIRYRSDFNRSHFVTMPTGLNVYSTIHIHTQTDQNFCETYMFVCIYYTYINIYIYIYMWHTNINLEPILFLCVCINVYFELFPPPKTRTHNGALSRKTTSDNASPPPGLRSLCMERGEDKYSKEKHFFISVRSNASTQNTSDIARAERRIRREGTRRRRRKLHGTTIWVEQQQQH